MTTQEQINVLESRQIALSNEMASSDAHASKCIKLGLDFRETYPEDYEAYTEARNEFSENEIALETLNRELEEEAGIAEEAECTEADGIHDNEE